MNGLGDVRVELAGVVEQLGSAYQHASLARANLADAVAVLGGLGEQHGRPLVPDELHRAADELQRCLALIGGGVAAVADLDARL